MAIKQAVPGTQALRKQQWFDWFRERAFHACRAAARGCVSRRVLPTNDPLPRVECGSRCSRRLRARQADVSDAEAGCAAILAC